MIIRLFDADTGEPPPLPVDPQNLLVDWQFTCEDDSGSSSCNLLSPRTAERTLPSSLRREAPARSSMRGRRGRPCREPGAMSRSPEAGRPPSRCSTRLVALRSRPGPVPSAHPDPAEQLVASATSAIWSAVWNATSEASLTGSFDSANETAVNSVSIGPGTSSFARIVCPVARRSRSMPSVRAVTKYFVALCTMPARCRSRAPGG